MFVSLEKVIQVTEEVVAERGEDFVYNPGGAYVCKYLPESGGAPSQEYTGCLVGEVLVKLGIPKDLLDVQVGSDTLLYVLEDLHILKVDEDSVNFLRNVQYKQDGGASWGDALAYGKNNLKGSANG